MLCGSWSCLKNADVELETVRRRAVGVMGGTRGLLRGGALGGEGGCSADSGGARGKAAKSEVAQSK